MEEFCKLSFNGYPNFEVDFCLVTQNPLFEASTPSLPPCHQQSHGSTQLGHTQTLLQAYNHFPIA